MYRYLSRDELVGTAQRDVAFEVPMPVDKRWLVFEPGPALPRVWPVLQDMQRAGMAMSESMQASIESRPSTSNQAACGAWLMQHMSPAVHAAFEAYRALDLVLETPGGQILRGNTSVTLVEYPMFLPEEDVEVVRLMGSWGGFTGDPPYYMLMVPRDAE